MRIALAANPISGGGVDPAALAEALRADGLPDVVVVPAGSRVALARRAWEMRTRTIAQQGDVVHARGRLVELSLPHGTAVNADGEVRAGGLERVTVDPGAFALVAGQ